MTLVGNDVVDLGDPHNAGAHFRARFVERVCAPSEREALARAAAPSSLLWSLFAAKEAAFKVVSKLLPEPPVFAHRQFVVAEDFNSVRYGALTLALEVRVEGACVHALCWLGAPPTAAGVQEIAPGDSASLAARRALLACYGEEGAAVERSPRPGSWDGYGPPRLVKQGRPVEVDVSLSHDGRYAAFALGS